MKPLLSIADVKALLPIRPANTEFDPRIKMAIMSATAQIEAATGRRFDRAVMTQFETARRTTRSAIDLHGSSDNGMLSYVDPLTLSLHGVKVDGDEPFEVRYDPRGVFGEDTIIDEDRAKLDPERGVAVISFPMRFAFKGIKITYTAGLVSTETSAGWDDLSEALVDELAPLKFACQMQAMHLFNKSSPETIGKTADGTDGSKRPTPWQVAGGLIPEVVSLVRPFRRMVLGRG